MRSIGAWRIWNSYGSSTDEFMLHGSQYNFVVSQSAE